MKNILLKDAVKEIKNTFKRFLSILLVVLLGVGFFAGIKATSPDMKKTLDEYFDKQNVMDIQVISTLGITEKDIETLKNVEGVENVVGSYLVDGIVTIQEEEEVVKIETITQDMNNLVVLEGRLPENENECVVEKSLLTWTGYEIGNSVKVEIGKIKDDEGNEKEVLKQKELTIVGTVESPMYISRERGSTKLGSGAIKYYLFVNQDAINTALYTTAYIKVKGAKELNCTSKDYTNLVEQIEKKVEDISDERKQERYDEIYENANKKIQEAREELNKEKEKAKRKIKEAETKIEEAKQKLEQGKQELKSNRSKAITSLENAVNRINTAEEELKNSTEEFNKAKEKGKREIAENEENLQGLKNIQTQYTKSKQNLNKAQKELIKLQQELGKLEPSTQPEEIKVLQQKIEKINEQIYILNMTISTIENQLLEKGISANSLASTITKSENAIQSAKQELEENEKKLQQAKIEINKQKKQLEATKMSTLAKLNAAERKLQEAEKEIKENEKKLVKSKKELEKKLNNAEEKLEKEELKLEDIQKPEWYILDRKENIGYTSYIQDTDRVANLATVFPVVFFVVATLISLTSMSRMVEEQRIQIGTLKALGYTKIQIANKYIIYALLATLLGAGIGLLIGFNFLPNIIANMYGMMYTVPKVILEFNTQYALIGTISALTCTIGATIYSAVKELTQTPANLMRPKSPKPGKRVFLERVPFIWSKLNFTKKVTARNIFRYKKRFLMTIIGVMGCTALILAGFGLRDSIAQMIPSQYGKIFKYNVQISLKSNVTRNEIQQEQEKVEGYENVTNSIKLDMQSIDIEEKDNNQSIQLIVPENEEKLEDFITLKSRTKKGEFYNLNTNGVIITEKLAKLLDIKVGDNIKLKNSDDVIVETRVENITENYLMHYIYMSPELYEKLYNQEFKANTILLNTNELIEEQENELGSKILESEDVISSVTFISNTEDIFSEVMNTMDFVVWVLIVSAGLLAFVVLYNLSNTNISERIRELATIKVLGFYNKEVYNYVGRETTILTIIGMLLGLIGGYFLTMFIIKTCELDMLMFDKKINTLSYIYAILITIVFASIVNIATYFALKKINMIESLKSVE